jgi:hypothetical protein
MEKIKINYRYWFQVPNILNYMTDYCPFIAHVDLFVMRCMAKSRTADLFMIEVTY